MSRSIKLHSDGREEYEGDEPMRVERYDQAQEIDRLKNKLADLREKVRGWAERVLDSKARVLNLDVLDAGEEMREAGE